jgi:selenocysteine lyase/cysteine desulfurase/SAM-dependent methyltransferase
VNAERFPAVVAAAAQGRILLDNAAGAQLPDLAIERVHQYLSEGNAQKGGIFRRPLATAALHDEARAACAELIGAPPEQIGTGLNGTSLAFAFSRLVASTLRHGDRVVVTAADHEANISPWLWLRRFGAQINVVPVDARGDLDEEQFLAFLAREPVLVALPWASNATGTVFDVARLAGAAKAAGALVVVDGVQAFPHFPLVLPAAVDFAFFSAYKCYAPHAGFCYASRYAIEHLLHVDDALLAGMVDPRSWTLEPGTQSYEAMAGWLGTVTYLRELAPDLRRAMAKIARYEEELAKHAAAHFVERSDRLRLYGRPPSEGRLPVFAFNAHNVRSDDLAEQLEAAGIEARVGNYYSPRLMEALAREAGSRAVRISFAHYNTREEIDRCFAVLDDALERNARTTARTTVSRFDRRADDYARHRPSYPPEAIDAVFAGLAPAAQLEVVDVGAGTGISTRLLAERGATVVGIEPNAEMREAALSTGLDVRDGHADSVGLPEASADLIASFQAFHWFATPEAIAEFARVLRPGGRVALVWNERDDADPFTRAYGELLDSFGDREALATYRDESEVLRELLPGAEAQALRVQSFPNPHRIDEAGLIGRARSTSYAPREGPNYERMLDGLRELFEQFAHDGELELVYRTDVYTWEKA